MWLSSHVPQLINQSKWLKSEENLGTGDIFLFTKEESPLSSTYQYGIIESIETGKDGLV